MRFEKAPLATAGLVLGLFGLGNLVKDISSLATAACGVVATFLWIYLIYSMLADWKSVQKQWQSPLVQSVFTTFFMSGLLSLVYLNNFFGSYRLIPEILKPMWFIWLISLIGHMIIFSKKYLLNLSLQSVFPSWTVLYVGIGVAALTAPLSHQLLLGKVIVCYGILATVVVLPLIFYRLQKYPLEAGMKPNTATICAPFSLVTAAYTATVETPNKLILACLLVASQFFYCYILIQLPKLLNRPFTPAFSSFTFPLVISATALKVSLKMLMPPLPMIWRLLVFLEIAVAVAIVTYVLAGYVRYIIQKNL